MQTRLRSQRGQATLDHVGVLVVAALVAAALAAAAPGFGARIGGGVERVVCEVTGLGSCGGPAAPAAAEPVVSDPALTASQRQALLGAPRDAQDVLASLSPAQRAWLERNDPQAAAGARAAAAWKQQLGVVERYQSSSLEDFLAYRDSAARDASLDWTTDGCSAPGVGGTGVSFDFQDACLRHDFGYRNYKRLGLFGERKAAVDRRFLRDMKDHCATRSVLLRPSCYRWAYTFYGGVSAFG